MNFYVDHRWNGHHGISRFANHVLPRLRVSFQNLTSEKPLGLLDAFAGARLSSRDRIYSPGFNAGISRARQLITIHDLIHLDTADEASTAKRLYYSAVVRPAVVRAGAVHTVSEFSRQRILEWLDSSNVDVINVGNGVDNTFDLEGLRANLLPQTFLYVGNVKPHKNAFVLLDALKLRPGYRILFVTSDGDEVLRRSLLAGVHNQVTTRSGVSDERLASLYRASSGLLFPSLIEGFGLPPLEALASGTTVAYSAQCAAAVEVVGPMGHAVADTRSASEWAVAMDELLEQTDGDDPGGRTGLRARHRWEDVGSRVNASLAGWLSQ